MTIPKLTLSLKETPIGISSTQQITKIIRNLLMVIRGSSGMEVNKYSDSDSLNNKPDRDSVHVN